MSPKKTIYYSSFEDDFAGTDITTAKVDGSFKYNHDGFWWNLAAKLLTSGVAYPVIFLISHIKYGLRFHNRKAVRKIKGGCFIYMNHTQWSDAFTPYQLAWPKRNRIIVGPDTVSIKGLKNIVQMFGAIPIPTERSGYRNFLETVSEECKKGRSITVFPEAHIWPYYNGIRPFSSVSFKYPVEQGVPAVAAVTTYRKRLFGLMSPGFSVYVSEPFYPDMSLPPKRAAEKLRDRVYEWMKECSESHENVAYIEYRKKAE